MVTLLAVPEHHPETAAVAVLYVLAVVIASRVAGALAGVATSILSFLALNFFFTDPVHTFAVGAREDWVSLFAFLVASVIVGLLFSAALDAKARSERREREPRLLNRMATRLLAGEPTAAVLDDLADRIHDLFQLKACEISTTITPPSSDGDSQGSETGLGLAICNAIVVAHGGRMWVSEAPAGGASFTFELPCDVSTGEEVADVPTRARR